MNIFIIGGTGFLGYHAAHELLMRDHQLTLLSLPPLPSKDLFPPEVKIVLEDLDQLSDGHFSQILSGHDALLFAAGMDDRSTSRAPAYPLFFHYNVANSLRVIRLAKISGIHRMVFLGSYFTHFDRLWPNLHLTQHHPYIRSRIEQEQQCLAAASPQVNCCFLELPYIFGSMPGRRPLWNPLVSYLSSSMPIIYTRGGTNCISVHRVAEAIAGAIEYGQAGERYLVGDENLTWVDMLTRLGNALNRQKTVHTIPDGFAKLGGAGVKLLHRIKRLEAGLDPKAYISLQTAETFFDPHPAYEALQFGGGGLDEAFIETVKACNGNRSR